MSERAIPLKHRDLSWIQFNERVLEEANDPANPLFERLKFLAITSSNLDEFFMIRYPSLIKSIQNARKSGSEETSELVRTRAEILRNVESFVLKQKQTLSNLQQQLAPEGIRIHRGVTEPLPASAKEVFDSRVLPALTPPEPYTVARLSLIPSLQQAVAFGKEALFLIPRTIPLVHVEQTGAELEVYFLDDLLLNFLGPAFQIAAPALLFRVTRDGDFTVEIKEEDPESIPDAVRVGLGVREKGRPVRIQARGASVSPLLNEISGHLKLVKDQIFVSSCPLALAGLSAVSGAAEKFEPKIQPLRYPRVEPYVPASLEIGDSVFQRIAREDILLHHPYDSFDAYVAWIRASSVDPAVERIEQTVYRMDALSPVIDALKSAAKSKTVRVLIELRARFDELNNLRLADELRKAGVQVAFGFGKLKLHAKVALVTRREGEGRRLYAHFSTGNYNAATARQYTDLAILTANPEICEDARNFLESTWEGKIPTQFKHIVSAPTRLHRRLLHQIELETKAAQEGRRARIFAKVNALVDEVVVEHLYRASQAGVKVDLVVRGACSLLPGKRGISENIRVISIVDRYLEHSRIYHFSDARALYLSSADWMPRNFFSRLELAFPILDKRLYRYLEEVVIPAYLEDTVKARELGSDGKWKRLTNRLGGSRSQFYFEELAARAYKGTPLGTPGVNPGQTS